MTEIQCEHCASDMEIEDERLEDDTRVFDLRCTACNSIGVFQVRLFKAPAKVKTGGAAELTEVTIP